MEIEITDNLITRGLRKFSLRIFKCSYVISNSKKMSFIYDMSKNDCLNKFNMSHLHFSTKIYNNEIIIYYKPMKKLCTITKDEKGELHFESNDEMDSSLYYSLLFKFLFSCSDSIVDNVFIDNDRMSRWATNVMR